MRLIKVFPNLFDTSDLVASFLHWQNVNNETISFILLIWFPYFLFTRTAIRFSGIMPSLLMTWSRDHHAKGKVVIMLLNIWCWCWGFHMHFDLRFEPLSSSLLVLSQCLTRNDQWLSLNIIFVRSAWVDLMSTRPVCLESLCFNK